MWVVILLFLANIFMTFAWYWHLRFQETNLWKLILISWGIAFFEYCLQVPANHWGKTVFSAYQLKIMQEILTMIVFVLFAVFYLKEPLKWNYLIAFGFILLAVYFVFKK